MDYLFIVFISDKMPFANHSSYPTTKNLNMKGKIIAKQNLI